MKIKCTVCSALEHFKGDDLIELKNALDGSVAKTDIAAALSMYDFPTSEASVRRHIKAHEGKRGVAK